MKRVIVKLGALLLVAAFAFAQSYEVSVTNISVWVKATDGSDKPVVGLTKDDFEIYEDGQKMPINCFEFTSPETSTIASSTSETQTEPATQPVPKKIAIYLDLYNMTSSEYLSVRPRLQEFLDQIAAKNWEVMLAALMPNGKLGVIAPFTKNVSAVSNSLIKAPTNNQRDTVDRTRVNQMTKALQNVLEARPEIQDSVLSYAYGVARGFASQDKDVSDFSLAALGTFTSYLTKLDTNEHIVVLFVSGGINVDPGRVYYDMAFRVAEQLGFTSDPLQGRFAGGTTRESNKDIQDGIRANIGKLNRHNVTVYAVNTRGMYSADNSAQSPILNSNDSTLMQDFQDSMVQLSEETGGLSFKNSRNFKFGFDQILNDLGQQYLICYSPPEHKSPGGYHKIKVVCKKKGVDLRYRTGYLDE